MFQARQRAYHDILRYIGPLGLLHTLDVAAHPHVHTHFAGGSRVLSSVETERNRL